MEKVKLLKLLDVAKILNVNPETLRRWDRSGKLVAVRIGSRQDRRYNVADIAKIVNSAKRNKKTGK